MQLRLRLPCNFNALPTTGKCEGGWTWHVDKGRYGDVALDGLNFSVYVNWPGAIHEGNGEALILVDERADDAQRAAIAELVGGEAGGPWGILAWTWPTCTAPCRWRTRSRSTACSRGCRRDRGRARVGPITNPVTGAEVHPGVVLPEGLIVKTGDLGGSTTFRVASGIAYDHSGQYTAVGPFDYTGE